IGLTIVQPGAVAHLEGANDIASGLVEFAGLGHRISGTLERALNPAYVWQTLALELRLVLCRLCFVKPPRQALVCQAFPWKQRARVDLALGCNIAVPNDVVPFYLVALNDILE